MDSKEYLIPHQNLDTLLTALKRLQNRAIKLGMVMDWTSKFSHEITSTSGKITKFYSLNLFGQTPKYEGWTFIATLQHIEAGTILRCIPGETIPESYRTASNYCDHCQSSRRRIDTFVVRHDNGKHKQVGRQCLKDFLGHDDPHALASFAELLITAGDLAASSANDPENDDCEDRERSNDPRAPQYYSLAHLLPTVAACCRVFGWTSRTAARDKGVSSTADDAFNQIYNPKLKPEEKIQLTAKDESDAISALEWAEKLVYKLPLSDYEHNVALVATSGMYEPRTLGIAASILSSWKRTVEQQHRAASMKYVGTVGEKIQWTLRLVSERTVEGRFGVKHLYTFADEEGNTIIWWTQSLDLTEGASYIVKGTIKKHAEYNGTKQTELTRCKVTALEVGTVTATCHQCSGSGRKYSQYSGSTTCSDCDGKGQLLHKAQ